MNATPKKRVNKTKEEITKDLHDKRAEAFKQELAALEDKYNYRLEPALHYSHKGVFPTINVVPVQPPVETKKDTVV